MPAKKINIFWFRRDLRIDDNCGLYHALHEKEDILPLFILDPEILSRFPDPDDARISFFYQRLLQLKITFENNGSSMLVFYGKPEDVFSRITTENFIETVYCNHDYEPSAIERDTRIQRLLAQKGIAFKSYKDQVIFEKDEILNNTGKPYSVFTPYASKWKQKYSVNPPASFPSSGLLHRLFKTDASPGIPLLKDFGYRQSDRSFPPEYPGDDVIRDYHRFRDYPGTNGTSRLGIHLRFGTISIRKLAKQAASLNPVFLNELIWREFYMMILYHFPHVVDHAFKPAYESIGWENNEDHFTIWCNGSTGYPIVDAGMRQLNATGYMHNRVRMITAGFLTKHLLIDWRWGEAYFARKLLDFELASNNGGWQWAAGTGCDAAPYFRVFSPDLQTKKFDPDHSYIKMWVPEYLKATYPAPIIEHGFARNRALEVYRKSLMAHG